MNSEKYRYLLCFSKFGPLRFIGHLDLLRVFQQTVRRAGLPVAYSQGFNPHQLISFALPLPLGMASGNDYAEIYFDKPVNEEEVVKSFNACCPDGLRLSLVKPFPDGPGVAACAYAADYEWKADDTAEVESAAIALLLRKEMIIPKKTKSGIKDTDIRPDIYGIVIKPGVVFMRLSAGSQRFLNPVMVAGLLAGGTDGGTADNVGTTPLTAEPLASVNNGQFIRRELYRLTSFGELESLSGEAPPALQTITAAQPPPVLPS